MSIFKSKQKVYNAKTGKYTPIWQLNTNKLTVTYTNPETLKIKRTAFHTDYIMYHLHYSADNYPDRLQRLVDNGGLHIKEIIAVSLGYTIAWYMYNAK